MSERKDTVGNMWAITTRSGTHFDNLYSDDVISAIAMATTCAVTSWSSEVDEARQFALKDADDIFAGREGFMFIFQIIIVDAKDHIMLFKDTVIAANKAEAMLSISPDEKTNKLLKSKDSGRVAVICKEVGEYAEYVKRVKVVE